MSEREPFGRETMTISIGRERIGYLLGIMTAVSIIVITITTVVLYLAYFEQQRQRLTETAESRARFIEAVSEYDYQDHLAINDAENAFDATLSQVIEAHKNYKGFGKTGEFTLAELRGSDIHFLLRHRHGQARTGMHTDKPVRMGSLFAEPMQRVLRGERGSMIGLDYREEKVLAAYEPIKWFGHDRKVGIVAKIDISEIKWPFIRAWLMTAAASMVVIIIGSILFIRVSNPLMQDLESYANRLEIANKELESFSYSISHDLRTPLRAIDGFSRILMEDYIDTLDDEGKRLLNVVRNSSRKMGELIDDVLTFSRIGRKELVKSDIDMQEILNEVMDNLKSEMEGRDIEVKVGLLPSTRGDKAMVRQCLFNLISNAIKFSGEEKKAVVQVSGRCDNSETVYSVRDNGVGFDMEYADKLFGVFQRLHSEEEFKGTGIGLAIVQRIAAKHGGRAWAEGKVGGGAAFYFSLPGSKG